MSDELMKALDDYAGRFGSFPTIPLLEHNSEATVILMIEKCLKEGKDVYDLGFLQMPADDECI